MSRGRPHVQGEHKVAGRAQGIAPTMDERAWEADLEVQGEHKASPLLWTNEPGKPIWRRGVILNDRPAEDEPHMIQSFASFVNRVHLGKG